MRIVILFLSVLLRLNWLECAHSRALSVLKFCPHCIQNVYVVMFLVSMYAKEMGSEKCDDRCNIDLDIF